jgi:GNAT superfamily N-acetyltransferase
VAGRGPRVDSRGVTGDSRSSAAPLVRSATPEDLAFLPLIESRAGAPFRDLGMDAVADDDPPTVEDLAPYVAGARAWVAVSREGVPVAHLLAEVVDGTAHIDQVSVDPAHARQGVGRALIAAVARWADAHGLPTITLTTFRDVPWNGPYYGRLGFAVVPADAVTPGLRRIRETERSRGLDAWPRVVMSCPTQRLLALPDPEAQILRSSRGGLQARRPRR